MIEDACQFKELSFMEKNDWESICTCVCILILNNMAVPTCTTYDILYSHFKGDRLSIQYTSDMP